MGFFIVETADWSIGKMSGFGPEEVSSILASAATLRERQNGCLLIRRAVKGCKQDSVCLAMFGKSFDDFRGIAWWHKAKAAR